MFKIISLFLIAIVILAMVGKIKTPSIGGNKSPKKVQKTRKCEQCGSYVIGKGTCACKTQKK